MSMPLVLLVTKHKAFASTASEQLSSSDVALRVLSPSEACESHRFPDRFPDVAFVDYEARTAGGSPLYQTVKIALQNCRIILLCGPDQASAAAQAVRREEAFDYILVDSVCDPNRISLLVHRVCSERLQKSPDSPRGTTGQRGPAERGSTERGPARQRRQIPETLDRTGTRVLVVEDDPVCGEMAKHILAAHGFEVILAATAGDAKAALTKHSPGTPQEIGIVLMDVHLGESNGLWLIKAMRSGHLCPDVPVVVVSSDRMRGTVHDAVGLDVQGYVLKPYQPSLMVETVKSALAKAGGVVGCER